METYNSIEVTKQLVKDGKIDQEIAETIFPQLKESEDERIRKQLLNWFKDCHWDSIDDGTLKRDDIIAWFEKQGYYINFRNKIQIGDEVTRNPDGVLVNLSQFKRKAKQGSQNLANSAKTCKDEPTRFMVGDWVVYNDDICQIVKREEGCNKLVTNFGIEKELVNERNLSTARLWTIQDAKDGDVLANNGNIILFKEISNSARKDYKYIKSHCLVLMHSFDFYTGGSYNLDDRFHPATKEQRELLFQKMKEAGYEWDAEKRELRKIEQNPAWSEEDKENISILIDLVESKEESMEVKIELLNWLKSLKERYTWKPSDEQMKAFYRYLNEGDRNLTIGESVLLRHLFNDLMKLKG